MQQRGGAGEPGPDEGSASAGGAAAAQRPADVIPAPPRPAGLSRRSSSSSLHSGYVSPPMPPPQMPHPGEARAGVSELV